MFKKERTYLADLWYLVPFHYRDERGTFTKLFHAPSMEALGVDAEALEEFCSVSNRNVLRGMHFQVPPYEHAKFVSCLAGSAHDVVLDMRIDSPTYGQWQSFQLRGESPGILCIPPGMAHGFCALEDNTLLFYRVSQVHQASADRGIRWDSFGADWPVQDPILSPRDGRWPAWHEFETPFRRSA